MRAAIGWVRDSKGRITKRTIKDVMNTITTLAGAKGFVDSYGLGNTSPYVLEVYETSI